MPKKQVLYRKLILLVKLKNVTVTGRHPDIETSRHLKLTVGEKETEMS